MVPAQEGREAFLEPAALAARRLFLEPLQCRPNLPRTPFPRITSQEIRKREPIPAVQVFGLPQHRDDDVHVHGRRQVEHRPVDRGHRDPLMHLPLVLRHRGDVPMDRSRRSAPMFHRHIDPRPPVRPDPPERRRRPMAQKGVRSRSEYRGDPPSVPRDQLARSRREDAGMDPMESTPSKPNGDRIPSEAGFLQLAPGHDPMLPTH